jgi:ATP-binding cassette subfamily B protein
VLAVLHRIAAFDSFDRVLVLMGGTIVEDGRPNILRKAGGAYQTYAALMQRCTENEPLAPP